MKESFSLIIPAYNEEKQVKGVLESYYHYLKDKGNDFEIIVVCNNCSDATPKIAASIAKDKDEIKVLNFSFYTGKGGAVLRGFKTAKNSVFGFTDCDSSTQPKEFDKLFAEIYRYDAIIGSRALPSSQVKKQSTVRVVLGKVFRIITKLLFAWKFNDTQCGAKIFKKKAIESILPMIKTKGWAFDVELLYRLKKKGYKIKEVGIAWCNSTESKVGFLAPFSMLWELLKIRFQK